MGNDAMATIRRIRGDVFTWITHRIFILTRGLMLGVRAACFDEAGRIFLVRHGYMPGWYMPGGGVERGESVPEALAKELREEGNLEIVGKPDLVQIYHQKSRVSRHGHVVFYRVDVRQTAPRKPDWEIVESGFFALDALPEGTTQATLRRLKELSGEVERSDYW